MARVYSPPHPKALRWTGGGCAYGEGPHASLMPCDEQYAGRAPDGGKCTYNFVSTRKAHFHRFPARTTFKRLQQLPGLQYIGRDCKRPRRKRP